MLGGMKTLLALVLALAIAALASAADLALKDGRTLRNATITGQSPTTVTVRHAEGFTQVEKGKLPDELAAQYPIDEAAAAQQRTAELSRAAQITRQQAAVATQIRNAPVRKKQQPDISTVQIAFRPKGMDSEDRWKWRKRNLTLHPSDDQLAVLTWVGVEQFDGSRHFRAKVVLKGPLWKITVSQICPLGQRGSASAIVSNPEGDKLACAYASGTESVVAYGNADGEAMLDVVSTHGMMKVRLEQAHVKPGYELP